MTKPRIAKLQEIELRSPQINGDANPCRVFRTSIPAILKTRPPFKNAPEKKMIVIRKIPAMAIDVETKRPRLKNIVGGLSGPAIRPIAVRLVYQTAQAVKIPIIGIGGIASHEDALEFILAGASAVQIGTMSFVDPSVWRKTLDGLEDYCRRHGVASLSELTGAVET